MKGRQADRALPAAAPPRPPPPATGPTRTSAGHRTSRRRFAPGPGPAFRPRRIRVSAAVRALAGFGCRRFLERSRGRISVPRLRFRCRGPSAEITGLECLHMMPANLSNESFDTGVTKRGGPDPYLNPSAAPRRLASPRQAFHRPIHQTGPIHTDSSVVDRRARARATASARHGGSSGDERRAAGAARKPWRETE